MTGNIMFEVDLLCYQQYHHEKKIITGLEDMTTTKSSVIEEEECLCSQVVYGIIDKCPMKDQHDCVCNMGPEAMEECQSDKHLCSCDEVTPETCRLPDEDNHECCCKTWGEASCRGVHHYTRTH